MKKKQNPSKQKKNTNFMFAKKGYKMMVIGTIMVIIGYALMTGGEMKDPDVFNEEEVFSFQRITLSVIFWLGGFILNLYAIFFTPNRSQS